MDSLLKFSPFPGLLFRANDPSFSYALVFLDPVTVTAEGPSCVSGQGEACIPQMTPTALLSTPTDACTRLKEAISVMPHTPYCSLTYWRYRTAHWVGESSGSTFKAMQLWGTYRDTAAATSCFSYQLISLFISQMMKWLFGVITHYQMMKRHHLSWKVEPTTCT